MNWPEPEIVTWWIEQIAQICLPITVGILGHNTLKLNRERRKDALFDKRFELFLDIAQLSSDIVERQENPDKFPIHEPVAKEFNFCVSIVNRSQFLYSHNSIIYHGVCWLVSRHYSYDFSDDLPDGYIFDLEKFSESFDEYLILGEF